jgi:hypothetical protein
MQDVETVRDNLYKNLETSSELSIEEIALILETKARARRKKNRLEEDSISPYKVETYEPFILGTEEAKRDLGEFIAGLDPSRPFKLEFIIYDPTVQHCTPMHISSNGIDILFMATDASSSDDNVSLLTKYYWSQSNINIKANSIFVAPKRQMDLINCSIFSIQDLNLMSNKNKEGTLTKDSLETDARLYRTTQTLSKLPTGLINKLATKEHPITEDKDKTLATHLKEFERIVEITDATGTQIRKSQNRFIDTKRAKYLKNAIELLEQVMSDKAEYEQLIERRTGRDILNTVYRELIKERPKLNEKMLKDLQIWGELYNKVQIESVLDFGLSIKVVKGAKCFGNYESSKLVYNHLSRIDKKCCREEFLRLKDLSTEELKLIVPDSSVLIAGSKAKQSSEFDVVPKQDTTISQEAISTFRRKIKELSTAIKNTETGQASTKSATQLPISPNARQNTVG